MTKKLEFYKNLYCFDLKRGEPQMKKSPPCPECPYKLGLAETVANPCPQCMLNDYKTFETFKIQTGHYNPKQNEDKQKNTLL